MLLSNAPRKVALPFAENGEKNTIPEGSSPSPGFASMNDGFPPLTRQPVGSGGIPPQGLDMNGIFYYLSSLNKWQSAGGSFVYDSTFANDSDVGGYPKGAILLRSDGDGFWLNRVDNNTTNPDTGGANWQPINNVGITSKTLTSSDVTLTNAEASKDIIVLSGTLTANVNLIVPVFVKQWIVANNTTGAFTVTVKTASGTGGLVAQGTSRVFFGDGTNIYGVNPLIASQAQVNTGTDNSTFLTPKTFKDSQLLADKADKNGNASNRFKVATPVDNDEAAQKGQLPVAATTLIAGLVRKVTQAEMNIGLSDAWPDAATLLNGFMQGSNYVKLPEWLGGWLIQYGYYVTGDLPDNTQFNFTIPLPVDYLSPPIPLVTGYSPSGGGNAFVANARSATTNSITVVLQEFSGVGQGATAGVHWLTIGK